MMIIFAVIFSLLYFSILCNNNRLRGVNMFSSYTMGFFVYYVLVPAIIEFLGIIREDSKIYFDIFLTNRGMYQVIYCFMVLTFFTILVVSYQSSTTKQVISINKYKLYKLAKRVGYISLFAGVPSLIIYFQYLGGFFSALAMAEFARSMAYDMADVLTANQLRLIVVVRLLILAPFCFFIVNSLKTNNLTKCYILISIIFTYIYLLFNASRTIIAIFTVALSFPILTKFTKHPWRLIILASLIGSNVLNFLDALFVSIGTEEDFEVIAFDPNHILMQFSFAYRNALNAFNIVEFGGCRCFQDLVTSFLNFVPGLSFQSSVEPTSQYWGGADWRLTGGIPNDIITYSVLEGHLFGFVLFPILIGKILNRVDGALCAITRENENSYITKIVKTYIMLALFFCVPSADLQSIIGNYTILVFFGIFILSSSKKKKIII